MDYNLLCSKSRSFCNSHQGITKNKYMESRAYVNATQVVIFGFRVLEKQRFRISTSTGIFSFTVCSRSLKH